VKFSVLVLISLFCAASFGLHAARQPPAPYTAVEVDRFTANPGVTYPFENRSALADDIAREISLAFPTVIIVRQGEASPEGHARLRITGVVTEFKPGSTAKGPLLGFGPGSSGVRAQVEFSDAATGQVLLRRELSGITWIALAGASTRTAGDSLARKIAKLCNSARLVASY
jgi:Domain of unknown function (DUF4410)